MEIINIYTDGSCLGNPGPGGWAFLLANSAGEVVFKQSGSEPLTTNNRMEMIALIKALEHLRQFLEKKPGLLLKIFSDSNLLVQTINLGWKKKANTDLWLQIERLLPHFKFQISWVKAHQNNKLNNICDKLAREAAEKQI